MRRAAAGENYIIISPVKDEEKYIETTIDAVLRQTIRPSRWVIVDDASRDRTASIIEQYAQRFPWITALRLVREGGRRPGSAVIQAFIAGYQRVLDTDYDFVVKLDGDLDLPLNYFEELIERFREDEALGIASGIYLECRRRRWRPVRMPHYHAAGAAKMVRAKCFSDIGGFVPSRGWDTIDEIRAQTRGWRTRHFEELQFLHLRCEGSASGSTPTNLMHGEIYYVCGGGKLFFLLKVLDRMLRGRPILWGGLAMLWGYLRSWATGKPLLVSEVEAGFYRHMLNRRIVSGMMSVFKSAG